MYLSIVLDPWLTVIQKIADFWQFFLRAPSRCALQLPIFVFTHGEPIVVQGETTAYPAVLGMPLVNTVTRAGAGMKVRYGQRDKACL